MGHGFCGCNANRSFAQLVLSCSPSTSQAQEALESVDEVAIAEGVTDAHAPRKSCQKVLGCWGPLSYCRVLNNHKHDAQIY